MSPSIDHDLEAVTFKQTARQLNVSERSVRAWAAADKIKTIRLGRCVRIPVSEIRRVLEEGI